MNIRDFTFDDYEALLDGALENGYRFYTLREYISNDEHETPCVVVRHDVDRKVATALEMARVEADRGIATTYYFRTSTFSPETVREVEGRGHEVGYHYEDLVKTRGTSKRPTSGSRRTSLGSASTPTYGRSVPTVARCRPTTTSICGTANGRSRSTG
ncbi:hypothetical protein [Halalkalicoccus salilacus]|uniref:hypothetical protein n=1 Tax=Halalkalicoccus sp. GCM10025704 TaxID=3252662 RepID=UPI003610B3F5